MAEKQSPKAIQIQDHRAKKTVWNEKECFLEQTLQDKMEQRGG